MGDKAVALARVAVGKVSGDQPGSATKRDPSCSSNCASSDTGKVDGGDGHDQSGGAGAGGIHKEKSGSDAGGERKLLALLTTNVAMDYLEEHERTARTSRNLCPNKFGAQGRAYKPSCPHHLQNVQIYW